MASYTPNLNLVLPVGTEKVRRQIINQNNEIIDSAVGNIVAPSVQSVSTLAELKTYLLAVAGSAEARKNVPVQFNLTAAASPFNSGLYTGIMQKETNGAFSVLCHGYNGGVVEVQYASSTWTIMNLTSEITSLNSKLFNTAFGTVSDADLQSKLITAASKLQPGEMGSINFYCAHNSTWLGENYGVFSGILIKYDANFFAIKITSTSGDFIHISYDNGTWKAENISSNISNITNQINPGSSDYIIADCNNPPDGLSIRRIINTTQNAPFSYGVLLSVNVGTGYKAQIGFNAGSRQMYYRCNTSSEWVTWTQISNAT